VGIVRNIHKSGPFTGLLVNAVASSIDVVMKCDNEGNALGNEGDSADLSAQRANTSLLQKQTRDAVRTAEIQPVAHQRRVREHVPVVENAQPR
jgi:hypothetical protein